MNVFKLGSDCLTISNLYLKKYCVIFSVVLEYSTDHGHRWEPLYEKCTTLKCFITLATTTAYFYGDQYDGYVTNL